MVLDFFVVVEKFYINSIFLLTTVCLDTLFFHNSVLVVCFRLDVCF